MIKSNNYIVNKNPSLEAELLGSSDYQADRTLRNLREKLPNHHSIFHYDLHQMLVDVQKNGD